MAIVYLAIADLLVGAYNAMEVHLHSWHQT